MASDSKLSNGGTGTDTASYATAAGLVKVSLTITTAQDTEGAGVDTLSNTIENLAGSAYDDQLTGSSAVNLLDGGSGNDLLAGVGGNDNLVGGKSIRSRDHLRERHRQPRSPHRARIATDSRAGKLNAAT